MDFAPPNTKPSGNYTYRFRLTDTGGDGWDIAANFSISTSGGRGNSGPLD